MKLLKTFAFATVLSAAVTAGAADTAPTKIAAKFGKIYSVEGFDSNDNVQIVGEGVFPNSCYRPAEAKVRVDHAQKTIYIAPQAYKYNGICLQVIVPFDKVLDLGMLQQGKYTIVQEGEPRALAQMNIRISTTQEPDDVMYAPVSQAFIQGIAAANRLTVTGEFPLSCMKVADLKTSVQKDVMVVQPIAVIDKSVPCNKGQFQFEAGKDLGPMKAGRYLLHVRSMNGKSINNFFQVR